MIGCAAKSGQFSYYRCNRALRHDPDVCKSGWLRKDRVEGFVVDRLREKVFTDENLAALVGMVNEEMKLLAGQRKERLAEIESQLEALNRKLLKYYVAFEKGTMSDEDAVPRIRELRAEQSRLQQAREEILASLEDAEPRALDREAVLHYVRDLKAVLSKGTLMEQKAFLRSFIKRIDYQPRQLAVNYTIPMPAGEGRACKDEVLSIDRCGRPYRTRTCDHLIKSQMLCQLS